MKTKYGKLIHPTKFQAGIIKDVKAYAAIMRERAQKYAKVARETVTFCYICGGGKFKPYLKVYGFEYVQCSKCEHVFTTKRLSQPQLNEFYKESVEYAKHYTSAEQIEYRIKNIAAPKIKYSMEFVPKVKNGRWLDVGSAIGDILKCVENYNGWKAIGLEASKDSVKVGREQLGVDVRRELFQDFSKKNPKEQFDVVSLFGYLEVITEPMKELKMVRKHLKKNGILIIGEANSDSFSTILQKSFPQYIMRHLIPPYVLQQFTKQSMIYALKAAGFEPIGFWDFGLDFYEFIKHLVILIPNFEKTPVYNYLMDNLNEFESVIDRQEKGDNFVMIARMI